MCVHVYLCVCMHVYVYMYVNLCVYIHVLVFLIPEGTEEDNWSLGMSCKACIALKHQCKYSYKITLSVEEKYVPLILDVSESLRNRSLIVSTTELPRASYTALCSVGPKRLDFVFFSYHKTKKTYATMKTSKGGFCRYWLKISLW